MNRVLRINIELERRRIDILPVPNETLQSNST